MVAGRTAVGIAGPHSGRLLAGPRGTAAAGRFREPGAFERLTVRRAALAGNRQRTGIRNRHPAGGDAELCRQLAHERRRAMVAEVHEPDDPPAVWRAALLAGGTPARGAPVQEVYIL